MTKERAQKRYFRAWKAYHYGPNNLDAEAWVEKYDPDIIAKRTKLRDALIVCALRVCECNLGVGHLLLLKALQGGWTHVAAGKLIRGLVRQGFARKVNGKHSTTKRGNDLLLCFPI